MAQLTQYKPLEDEDSTLSIEKTLRTIFNLFDQSIANRLSEQSEKQKKTFFNFLLKILLDIS